VFKRGYEKFNGRSYNPLFYLTTAPLSLFPWIVFAPLAWFALKTRDIRHRWLASWLAAPYLIFTFYATQLPHYVLPAFPAFFLLLGEGLTSFRPAWKRGGLLALAVVAVIALAALGLVWVRPLPEFAAMLKPAVSGLLVVVLGLVGIAGGVVKDGRWLRPGLIGGGLCVATGAVLLAGGLRAASLSIALPARWFDAPANTRFIGAGFTEPSLVFYSHRLWLNDLAPAELDAEISKPGPLVVVTVDRQIDPIHLFTGLDRWKAQTAPPSALTLPGWTRQTLAGFNPGRTRWQELSVWRRD
jgi:4-amino-4-deoxy-L-arabinose transferase-like glycosyltransferase